VAEDQGPRLHRLPFGHRHLAPRTRATGGTRKLPARRSTVIPGVRGPRSRSECTTGCTRR
jgi:hypothetical protein